MQKLKNSKLIIVFLLVLALFVYEKFFASSDDTTLVSDQSVVFDKNLALVGNEFLDYLAQVKNIKVDDSLFKSTAWTNLRDFSKPLPEVSPGKEDLFGGQAPVVDTSKTRR